MVTLRTSKCSRCGREVDIIRKATGKVVLVERETLWVIPRQFYPYVYVGPGGQSMGGEESYHEEPGAVPAYREHRFLCPAGSRPLFRREETPKRRKAAAAQTGTARRREPEGGAEQLSLFDYRTDRTKDLGVSR